MNKVTISCIDCGNQMQIPSDKHIRFTCPSCKADLEAINGKVFSYVDFGNQHSSQQNNRRRTNINNQNGTRNNESSRLGLYVLLGIIGFIILISLYNWMTGESKSYNRIKKTPVERKIDRHLKKYKDGKYTAELTIMRDSLIYHTAMDKYESKAKINANECYNLKRNYSRMATYKVQELKAEFEQCMFENIQVNRNFSAIEAYKKEFPDNKNQDSLKVLESSIWASLIDSYKSKNKTKGVDKKKALFMTNFLEYIRDSGQDTIDVVFDAKWDLKDWMDYSNEERAVVDTLIKYSNMIENTNYPLPSTRQPLGFNFNV